jgi:hypothetical protein
VVRLENEHAVVEKQQEDVREMVLELDPRSAA